MQLVQTIKVGQPEASNNLVQSTPVKDGTKLVPHQFSWEETIGFGWILHEDWE